MYEKEATERKRKKMEIIKICPKKGRNRLLLGGGRRQGGISVGRSLINVAKSKGNGDMGEMKECSLWESTANTGMEEMIRGTGTLEFENMLNGDPSWMTQAHKEGWVVWNGGEEVSIQKGQTARAGEVQGKWTERIKTKELDHPWMTRRRNEHWRRKWCEE